MKEPPDAPATPATHVHSDPLSRRALRLRDGLPGQLGIELVEVRPGYLCLEMAIRPQHMAANGYLHAGAVVTLADTACGFGCIASLPDGAQSFTTIELKTNFMRTASEGRIRAEARLVHGGRRTQVWDATVLDASGRVLALFRCTQMVLYSD
jgi:uncharacterized protein (TIGR00369 family)